MSRIILFNTFYNVLLYDEILYVKLYEIFKIVVFTKKSLITLRWPCLTSLSWNLISQKGSNEKKKITFHKTFVFSSFK